MNAIQRARGRPVLALALASALALCARVTPAATRAPERPGPDGPATVDSLEVAASDSLRSAGPDSLADPVLGLPAAFAPEASTRRPFLRPEPRARRVPLAGLSAFDAFLAPPEGPALYLDRADLRLTGPTEWWDVAYLVPALFTLRPGYPGTTTPFSFRAHGPDGTMLLYDARPLHGGYTPIENPGPIPKGHLSGVAVMRAGASHLYGPGAGAGALLFFPAASAPPRPYTEATTESGVFGQRSGSFTTAFRWGRSGVLLEYAGAGAAPWSLFDGFRAERFAGRIDWHSGHTRVTLTGRAGDERLRHFDLREKRSDDLREGTLSIEHEAGGWVTAVRAIRHESSVRADASDGFAFADLERSGGEVLLVRSFGTTRAGVLAGASTDRRERRDVFATREVRTRSATHAVARFDAELMGAGVDVAARYDRTPTGRDVVAVGGTIRRRLDTGSLAWIHVALTSDRPAFFHRISDAYTQADQGIDRPWPEGASVPRGRMAAAGAELELGRARFELGGSVERYERVWAQVLEPHQGPLPLREPHTWRTEEIDAAGGWASIAFGPLWLGRWIGSLDLGGSLFVGSTPEIRRVQVEPWRYGETYVRLRRELFGGALRVEAEADHEMLGEMPTLFGDLKPQSQLTVRMTAAIGDVLIYYRSENVLDQAFFSSAEDEELGYVPITARNVSVGASWVLLD